MPPSINLIIAIPAVMTTNTMANPTDNADVYLKESNTTNKIKHKNNQQTHIIPTNTKPQSFISDYHIEFKIQNSILSQHKKPNEQ